MVVFSLLGGACSKTNVTRGADGVLRLECARGMKDCVAQAEKYCNVQDNEAGYVVLGGASHKVIMGAKEGQYRTAAETAELEVRCGNEPLEEDYKEGTSTFELPPRTDEAVVPSDLPSQETAPVASLCTKGATQACVGPGACQGGQVCLEDGSGFGPCDCGEDSKAETKELTSGSEPKPSVPSTQTPAAQPL